MVVSNYPPCRALANQAELHKNTPSGNRHKKKIFCKCYTSPYIHQRYQSLMCRMPKAEAARLEDTQYLENEAIPLTCLTHMELSSEGTYSSGFKTQGCSLGWVTEERNKAGQLCHKLITWSAPPARPSLAGRDDFTKCWKACEVSSWTGALEPIKPCRALLCLHKALLR